MKQTPIGLIIKEAASAKNLKASKLATLLNKSRQTIYFTFGRDEMSDEELQEWANVLGTTKQSLLDKWKNSTTEEAAPESSYLLEHLVSLEEQFKRLLNQIDVKDRQIEGLQKTVEVLLGKSKPVTEKGKVMEMYKNQEAS